MAQFAKKKFLVNAVQWEASIESENEISNFSKRPVGLDENPDYLIVDMPDKMIVLTVGDWLIKELDGQFHSCNSNTFEHEYQSVK